MEQEGRRIVLLVTVMSYSDAINTYYYCHYYAVYSHNGDFWPRVMIQVIHVWGMPCVVA